MTGGGVTTDTPIEVDSFKDTPIKSPPNAAASLPDPVTPKASPSPLTGFGAFTVSPPTPKPTRPAAKAPKPSSAPKPLSADQQLAVQGKKLLTVWKAAYHKTPDVTVTVTEWQSWCRMAKALAKDGVQPHEMQRACDHVMSKWSDRSFCTFGAVAKCIGEFTDKHLEAKQSKERANLARDENKVPNNRREEYRKKANAELIALYRSGKRSRPPSISEMYARGQELWELDLSQGNVTEG